MLARQMSEGLHESAVVVELGAGTGTVTQAILDCGVAAGNLYLVERNAKFASILRQRFPGSDVLQCEADTAALHWRHLVGRVDFVVSGLPIVWFDRARKARILDAAFTLLGPHGCLHQFTYLGLPPVGRGLRSSMCLRAKLLSYAPLNFPPAFVYRFAKATPA
jgi:phospholipid N-methyltransferase